jgi:hypothetical protein
MVGGIDHDNFNTITLIPEMNFTCKGTIEKVMVAGKRQNFKGSNPMHMQLQIWRPDSENTTYRRGKSIALSPSVCEMIGKICDMINNDAILLVECTLNTKDLVLVEPGDILGINIPEHKVNFELYSITESRLTSYRYIFKRDQSAIVNLSETTEENISQPLISVEMKTSKLGIIIIMMMIV